MISLVVWPRTVPLMEIMAQALPVLRDTVVTVAATPQGWAFWADTLTSIATVVIALAIIVGGLAAIPLGLNALRALRTVNQLAAQVRGDIAPLIKHGHAAAENVDLIVGAMRQNVQMLSQTVASANERLDRAAEQAEERIADFNALLQVIQEEAEGLFIDTASTMRGARVSAEALRHFQVSDPQNKESHPS